MVRQFQDTMQDQNALLLGGQTGKGIRHKLVVDMQVIPMGRESKSVAGIPVNHIEIVHLGLRKIAE